MQQIDQEANESVHHDLLQGCLLNVGAARKGVILERNPPAVCRSSKSAMYTCTLSIALHTAHLEDALP